MNRYISKNIVFITGAFVSHSCWDDWRSYFENEDFDTIAPAWPYKNATTTELRNRHPNDPYLAALTLNELIDHYTNIVKSFIDKPMVIGHSLGGLIAQILVNRDLVLAGVAIHSVPPLGAIPYEFSFLKSAWKSLGLFTSLKKTYLMSFKDWQYAFVNGMPLEEQKAAYEKYAIPESKSVARDVLTSAAIVDFTKPHPPLLLTSGSTDNIIPAHLNLRNFKKYIQNNSVLEYKEFEGRNHFVLGQPTWKEDADYILKWLNHFQLSQRILRRAG
jgi:pimeloyl-ACP methyl ester carboxylesterase